MKQCPQCRDSYTDDNLFCLVDGTPLQPSESYTGGQFSGDMPTVVIPAVPAASSASGAGASRPIPDQRRNNWLYPVVGILAGLVIVLGFLLVYKFNSNDKQPEYATVKENTDKQTPTPTPARIETPTPPATMPKPAPVYLPERSRVKFGKGKVSANVTGLVPPGADRSLVLACRAGQYLSATVASPGGCVSFADGSANIATYTVAGDNFIYIKNNCGADGSFNMTIFIK